MILRKQQDEQDKFLRMIGECHVHGIMDGELMADLTDPQIEASEKFHIV